MSSCQYVSQIIRIFFTMIMIKKLRFSNKKLQNIKLLKASSIFFTNLQRWAMDSQAGQLDGPCKSERFDWRMDCFQ